MDSDKGICMRPYAFEVGFEAMIFIFFLTTKYFVTM